MYLCQQLLRKQFQTRGVSYKNSKLVEDDSKYTEFEVFHNPEEWKYVERLLPIKWIPDPKPKENYPSGWIPQKGAVRLTVNSSKPFCCTLTF
ncbi:54S ribosomal protein L49, mitochondrial [Homalodisca vitripennis]|nr:54S ribosomal protein L49, mitochondrial [Homalodisca vitripennis]